MLDSSARHAHIVPTGACIYRASARCKQNACQTKRRRKRTSGETGVGEAAAKAKAKRMSSTRGRVDIRVLESVHNQYAIIST